MRNSHRWSATKLRFDEGGKLRVPGAPGGVAPGSILIASLIARWYARVLPVYASGTLLEVGCGKMPFYQLYSRHVDEVLCTDWPGSLHGVTFLDFAADLNSGIPLCTGSVDTVLASDVAEHIYQPHQLLREMFRVLRPGGIAFINTPFLYWVHEVPFDYYRYTQFALKRMSSEAGFHVEQLTAIGGGPAVLIDVIGKLLQQLPRIGMPLARVVQSLWVARSPGLQESEHFPLFIAAVLRKPREAR